MKHYRQELGDFSFANHKQRMFQQMHASTCLLSTNPLVAVSCPRKCNNPGIFFGEYWSSWIFWLCESRLEIQGTKSVYFWPLWQQKSLQIGVQSPVGSGPYFHATGGPCWCWQTETFKGMPHVKGHKFSRVTAGPLVWHLSLNSMQKEINR